MEKSLSLTELEITTVRQALKGMRDNLADLLLDGKISRQSWDHSESRIADILEKLDEIDK